MVTTERQGLILEKIIQEYIKSARPVSSQFLEKKYDFGICPAMIRIEMERLTNEGFLYQPFISAGRVPTDKSYRFLVDKILDRGIFLFKEFAEIEKILDEEKKDSFKFASRLTKFLAHSSSNIALLHFLEEDLSIKEGWEEIIKEPEFEDRGLFSDFTGFLDDLEENIENLKLSSGTKIYIGGENPFGRTKNFSIISSRCLFPDGKDRIVVIAGPKRMPYRKNIGLINSLTKLTNNI